MAEEALLVLSTVPDIELARQIARTLVEERLAACGNILPQVESIYRWQEKVETSNEVLLMLKTTIGRYQALEERLRGLHPYEVPEIICVSLYSGLPAYLTWVSESCSV